MSRYFQNRFPEQAIGNIFVRTMLLTRGEVVHSHAHHFDHTTYCIKGSIRVEKTGFSPVTLEPGDFLLIAANTEHTVTAMEDTLAHCIYAHRTAQGEIVQEFTGWPDAYI